MMNKFGVVKNDLTFVRNPLKRFSTGSSNFDSLLGGGLPHSCILDVFGAAGTGKTQFAFQNALMTCSSTLGETSAGPRVVFVDCAGSFRPERIVEMAENRSVNPQRILERILSVYVRSVEEQVAAIHRIEEDPVFRETRLIVIDDVTSNFVSDYSADTEIAARQLILSNYARHLSYLANRRGFCILLTNSIRSRGELGETETTGEALSPFVLCALFFSRKDRIRFAELVQPDVSSDPLSFEINQTGIIER
jgi:RecA/RadA recombinase